MAGAFDVPAAQCVGLGGAGVEFGLHGEGDLERVRGEGVEQQGADGVVDDCAGDGLAAGRAVLDAAVHGIGSRGPRRRGGCGSARVIRRPQRPQIARPCSSAVPSRAGPAARSLPCAVALASSSRWLVSYGLPADVAGVGVGDQRDPLVARQDLEGLLAVGGRGVRGAGRRRTRRRSGGCAGCAAPASVAAASRPARPCGRRCAPGPGTAARRR